MAVTSAGRAPATAGPRYKWTAPSNTSLAIFMSAVDGSIVIIALPAIFNGIHLDPLAPGNVAYLLCMIMGYRLVQAVLVVTLGRLGDRIRELAAGNAAGLVSSVARGGLQFMLIIWLQGIRLPLHGYDDADTPLWAGIYPLPMTVAFLVAGPVSGALSDRYGSRGLATATMLVFGASFVGLLLVPVTSPTGCSPCSSRSTGSATASSAHRTRHRSWAACRPGTAFSAVLGVNPVEHLLSSAGALGSLPAAGRQVLTGRQFFPQLISGPFHQGLVVVFSTAAALSVLGAFASLLRGRRAQRDAQPDDVLPDDVLDALAPPSDHGDAPTASPRVGQR